MLCNSDVSFDREERHLRFLAEQRVAGILITPWAPQTRAHLDQLRRRGVKIVLIDEPANAPDQCSVSVDDVMGGEIAGNYLLGIGRRRIAYLNYREPIRQFDERLQGLRRAIENHPDRSEVELLEIKLDDMKSANGFGATSEVLKRRPDAAFCANDLIALGLMRGLVDHGVRIPEDIAMIGYDDIEFSALAPVPLSSIRQPTIQMGRAAMRLLLEECTGSPGHAHSHVVFSPELVVRASTEPVAR
jgi:LacI family transcriptional regulator